MLLAFSGQDTYSRTILDPLAGTAHAEIDSWLERIVRAYPAHVTSIHIGRTVPE